MNEVKTEIPSISGFSTTSALTAVENKIPNVSNLVKQIMTIKLLKVKREILIVSMINILLLQNLIYLLKIS